MVGGSIERESANPVSGIIDFSQTSYVAFIDTDSSSVYSKLDGPLAFPTSPVSHGFLPPLAKAHNFVFRVPSPTLSGPIPHSPC